MELKRTIVGSRQLNGQDEHGQFRCVPPLKLAVEGIGSTMGATGIQY